MIVSVRAVASRRAVFLCRRLSYTSMSNLSRLNGSTALSVATTRLCDNSAVSEVVNTALQDRQRRRRQIAFRRCWRRELTTWVLPEQYIHTMTTY